MKSKKICLYARVSTDMQATGLETQCRSLSEYCKANKYLDTELFTDENQSGAKASRPSLDRMMALVRSGEVDKVICYSLSRLGRSTTHLLKLMEEMNRHNVKFISLSERLETETPSGKMVFTVLAAVSQLERELIAERVRAGLANARAKGVRIGREKKRDSVLIRKLLATGMTMRMIASVAKTSTGSIYAEKISIKKEEAAARALAENPPSDETKESSSPLDTVSKFPNAQQAP